MLIPIKHENMEARRWPVVTLALIAINVVAFLFTMSAIDDEAPQLGELKSHILILAALHLLNKKPDPTLEDIREGLSGNLCRCTGYIQIFEAVAEAARRRSVALRPLTHIPPTRVVGSISATLSPRFAASTAAATPPEEACTTTISKGGRRREEG